MLETEPPDLMLLDILMPDMSGWQVLELKDQDGDLRDIPVLLVSAQDPQEGPVVSGVVVVTMGKGLSVGKLLRCSQALPAILMEPD